MEQKRRSFLILLFVLAVFTVGAAVFSGEDDMVYEPTEEEEAAEEQSVSAAPAESDFFADFRIGREQRRDEEKELYQSVMLDDNRDEEAKKEAEAALTELYRVSSMEDRVEEILIGRNYRDVIFVMEDTISLLILGQRDLDESEKADLIAFVSTYAGIAPESLSVFTID